MQPCPRQQQEATLPSQLSHKSEWKPASQFYRSFNADREYESNVCTYCGSVHPDVLFEAIEKGWTITPTDKNYKIYIDIPNPNADKETEVGSSSEPLYDEFGVHVKDHKDQYVYKRTPIMGKAGDHHVEFYFQHLTQEERDKFIAAYNEKRIKMAAPGYFYVTPFFASPKEKSE